MLLLINNLYFSFKEYKAYLDFFFLRLKSFAEKKHFLDSFNDQNVTSAIKEYISLFIESPFYSSNILSISDKDTEISHITKWQKSFYKNIYCEYKLESKDAELPELFNRLIATNRSFQYLVSLEKEVNFDNLVFFLSNHTDSEKKLS